MHKYTAGNTETFLMYKKRVSFMIWMDVKLIALVVFGFKSLEQILLHKSHIKALPRENPLCIQDGFISTGVKLQND